MKRLFVLFVLVFGWSMVNAQTTGEGDVLFEGVVLSACSVTPTAPGVLEHDAGSWTTLTSGAATLTCNSAADISISDPQPQASTVNGDTLTGSGTCTATDGLGLTVSSSNPATLLLPVTAVLLSVTMQFDANETAPQSDAYPFVCTITATPQ